MANMIIRSGVALLLVGSLAGTGKPDPTPRILSTAESGKAVLATKEDLVYEVSWTIFKLGTIRLRTNTDYSADAFIDSYEGLPFVDLHSYNHTQMDSMFFSKGSHAVDKKDTDWVGFDYVTDVAHKRVRIEEIHQKDVHSAPYDRTVRDSIQLQSMDFLDGLSIGYYPRALIHTRDTAKVQTILYGKLGTTTFYFSGKKSEEKIDAVERPVRVIEVPGTTTVEGIYGMTGAFTGWFSDDSAGVPIKGKLKILLGNVNVELIQWKRPGWQPPVAE